MVSPNGVRVIFDCLLQCDANFPGVDFDAPIGSNGRGVGVGTSTRAGDCTAFALFGE